MGNAAAVHVKKTRPGDTSSPPPTRSLAFNLYEQFLGTKEDLSEALSVEFPAEAPKESFMNSAILEVELAGMSLLTYGASRATAKRATHGVGRGGAGEATVTPDPAVPQSEFFKPGQTFGVRCRHSNAINYLAHDGSICPRGLAFKFADQRVQAPLDLFLNTGEQAGWPNAACFMEFMKMQVSGSDEQHTAYLKKFPHSLEAMLTGYKSAPTSYADLTYYSQTTYEFKAFDGKRRVCRFRAVPVRRGNELFEDPFPVLPSELHSQLVLRHNAKSCKEVAGEDRDADYLRQEYAARLNSGEEIMWRVQIQLWVEPTEHHVFNPNLPWDRVAHPYLDLITININRALPDDEIENTLFWIGRLPPSTMSLCEAVSVEDFNSLNIFRRETHKASQRGRLEAASSSKDSRGESDDSVEYHVMCETGSFETAGTDDNVTFRMEGSKGESLSHELHRATTVWSIFETAFERGGEGHFVVSDVDVGSLKALKVASTGKPWFCQRISVKVRRPASTDADEPSAVTTWWFPCYAWIDNEGRILLPSTSGLAMAEEAGTVPLGETRKLSISSERAKWEWSDKTDKALGGFPLHPEYGSMRDLPQDRRFDYWKTVSFGLVKAEATHGLVEAAYTQFFTSLLNGEFVSLGETLGDDFWDSIEDFAELFVGPLEKRERWARWDDDAEFGDMMLNGCNPDKLRRVVGALPAGLHGFNLDEALLAPFLDGRSLPEAIRAGALYVAECGPYLEGVPTWDGSRATPGSPSMTTRRRYMASHARALFVVRPSTAHHPAGNHPAGGRPMGKTKEGPTGRLMPVAIQLEEGPNAPVWTPNDAPIEWTTAKVYFKNSMAQIHQFCTHLFSTHLVLEPFVIASWRTLATCHPVAKLLHHHLKDLVAINTHGRQILIPHGGIGDVCLSVGGGGHEKLMSKCYVEIFDFNDFAFPQRMARWGLDDVGALPHFHYRDDALAIYHAITVFVSAIIGCHYRGDDDVRADRELQEWVADAAFALSKAKNVIRQLDTKDELISLCSNLIFELSVQHAAVNYSQYDEYAFPPYHPMSLMEPTPTAKGEATMERLLRSFPTKAIHAHTVATGFVLSKLADPKVEPRLGSYPDAVFGLAGELEACKAFQQALDKISDRVEDRLAQPLTVSGDHYQYLNPRRIPNGIHI